MDGLLRSVEEEEGFLAREVINDLRGVVEESRVEAECRVQYAPSGSKDERDGGQGLVLAAGFLKIL